jgi:endoglycosylceramidase
MMWPGVETSRLVYNQTYINVMQQIVNNLAAKDMYTLLDCHQDLLSPKFCGEGSISEVTPSHILDCVF